MQRENGRGRRFSKEKQQERISRNQFEEEFEEWLANPLLEDLGEDLFVQIYDDGHSTGLSFLVQLKSTRALEGLTLKSEPVVSYSFETRDLEHWEDQTPPVVLVVWDVNSRRGVWLDMPAVVEQLNDRNENWRKQTEVTVHLPVDNGTGEVGRAALRQRICDLTMPSLSRGKQLQLKPSFRFPKTEEGVAAYQALQRAVDFGETATIPGKFITQLRGSPWWERAMGTRAPDYLTISTTESTLTMPMKVIAVSDQRTEIIPVNLRRIKAGLRQIMFSNEHETAPLRVVLTLTTPEEGAGYGAPHPESDSDTPEPEPIMDARLSYSYPRPTVAETLALLRFLLALTEAGKAYFCLADETPIGEVRREAFEMIPEKSELLAWEQLLMKAAFVQMQLSRFGQFELSDEVTDDDAIALDRLHSICKTGTWEETGAWAFGLSSPPKGSFESGESEPSLVIELPYPRQAISVFGVTIPIGKVRAEFLDPAPAVAAFVKAGKTGATHIEIHNARVRFELLAWGEPPAIE